MYGWKPLVLLTALLNETMAKIEAKVKTFYGDGSKRASKNWEQKRIKLEKCATDFSQNPIISTRKHRIDDPLPVYETFPRQQMAFDYVRTCHQDVHVFAREKDNLGKRVYIVATLPQLWYKYTRECPEDRNYYEVIPEGAACRLYFDLEFKTELNPEKSGNKMVNIFIKYVCHHLMDMHKLNCDRKHVIDLDSSTTSKFSRHLIFHLPGAVFKDNIHAGNFVRHICTLLERKLGVGSEMFNKQLTEKDLTVPHCSDTPNTVIQKDCKDYEHNEEAATIVSNSTDDVPSPDDVKSCEKKEKENFYSVNIEELRELIIKDAKGGLGTFIDQGVYTKNRNFRILKSTKFGKNSHLLVSSQNTFKPSFKDRKGSFSKDPEYLLFLDSLVSNVSMQVGGQDVKVLTCDSCVKSSKTFSHTEAQDSSSPTPSQCGYEHSPYPDIDIFISRVINNGGIQGEIRRWVYFPQGKLLTYDILKNRWCENIGRPHKSNHIMIVVDLRLGVYYQKCHDPDCKRIDYRSPGRPIPDAINPLSDAQSGAELFFASDDEDRELCKAAAECENLGCDNMNHNCSSSEKQDGSCMEIHISDSKKSVTYGDIKWDDEEDDEALLEADVPQGACHSTKSLMKCPQNTVDTLQANDTRECLESLDSGNKEPMLNTVKSIDAARSEEISGNQESSYVGMDKTSVKLSLEKCGSADNMLDSVSNEEVCNWLDEDPVSDLELSFAAEEVESRT